MENTALNKLLSPEERAEKVAASIGQVALWNPTFYSVQQQIVDPHVHYGQYYGWHVCWYPE